MTDKNNFQRTNQLAKAPHIYKGTQAQTQKLTFVKECCMQTLPKPLDTIKTGCSKTNKTAYNMGFCAMLADGINIGSKSLIGYISVRRNTIEH